MTSCCARTNFCRFFKNTPLSQITGTTLLRNSFLFSAFVVYMDFFNQIEQQVFPSGSLEKSVSFMSANSRAFLQGAVCSSMAWATIWPLDVLKSYRQAAFLETSTMKLPALAKYIYQKEGGVIGLYKGMGPGLLRSALANGCSMIVYKKVEQWLREKEK